MNLQTSIQCLKGKVDDMTNTYKKARTFIYRNARPLDLARFQFHFEGGNAEAVLMALAAYQNEDGGFGHALEPDYWNPHSSPIQTWAATEILLEVGQEDASHPIVQGILRYLGSGTDFDGKLWANEVPSNNDYPHAPWWHFGKPVTNEYDYNPTAALAGFILRFAAHDSELHALGQRIADEAAEAYLAGKAGDGSYSNVLFVRLAQVLDNPALTQALQGCNTTHYDFPPEAQLPDGSWEMPWGWGDYPEEWAVSQNWWKSHIIIENLLKAPNSHNKQDGAII